MSEQHTRGPWAIERVKSPDNDTLVYARIGPVGRGSIAYSGVYGDKKGNAKLSESEAEANAQLIAAAPETAQQRDEFRGLLIKCYQYMTGQKPRPDAAMLTKELHETMDKIGITGTAKARP